MTRKSIHAEGFSHKNPIPSACRIGPMLYSGSILGTDPATGAYGATLEAQCELMFDQMRRVVQAGGGTLNDVIKMTVWMRDRNQRAALNAVWLKVFPDAHDRPARHTMQADLDGDKLIECDFVAVIEGDNLA